MQDNLFCKTLKIIAMMPIIFFLVTFVIYSSTRYNDHDYIVTVVEKEHIPNHEHNEYLIHCKDEAGEYLTIKNVNSYYRVKFDSIDIQENIKEGSTYKLTVIGHRVPVFNMYENLIYAEEITIE